MTQEIHCRFHLENGPILTYSISCRKEPIAEVYKLDRGYLALWAGVTSGYTRQTYKTEQSAKRAAEREAVRLVKNYFYEAKIIYDVNA